MWAMSLPTSCWLSLKLFLRCLHSGATNHRSDSVSSNYWILVLPNPYNGPACFRELPVSVLVTLPIASDLRTPEVLVDLGRAQVIGASVPEATIEKGSHFGAGEDEIRCPAQLRYRSNIDSVPQSEGVGGRAESAFWPGISPAICLHNRPACLGGGPGFLHSAPMTVQRRWESCGFGLELSTPATALVKTSPNVTGTALPSCLICSPRGPASHHLSENVITRATSRTVI
jgi:hypothetical protein